MMFLRLSFVLIALIPCCSFGQSNVISIGIDGAFPSESLGASAGTGIGGTIRYERGIATGMAVIGTASYLSFAEKTVSFGSPPTSISSTYSMIPIQAGAKLYPLSRNMRKRQGIYVSAELGVNVIHLETTTSVFGTDTENTTKFCFAPGIGYDMGKLELSWHQQFTPNGAQPFNFAGFRIAYVFRQL